MNNKQRIPKTSLFRANALGQHVDDFSKDKIFQGVHGGIKRYIDFVGQCKKVVQKQDSIEIELNPTRVLGEDSKKKELRFYLEIDNLKKQEIDKIENEFFTREIPTVYLEKPSGISFQDKAIKIKIIGRNEDDKYLILDTEEELKKVYLKANDYQLNMQLKALKQLKDMPMPEHEPLLRLFEKSNFASSFFAQNYDSNVRVEDNAWKILKSENGQPLRSGTDEQRNFVRKALATKDFALLEGPPGSGKTTAIIELILQCIERGQRVLLVSATHVAVDNVIHRILTRYKEECAGKVVPIRIGNEDSIRKDSVKEYRLQKFVGKTKQDIRNNIKNRQDSSSRKRLYRDLKSGKQSKFDDIILNSANLVAGTMIGILQHPNIKKGGIQEMFDVMIVDESSKVTFLDFIVPALYAKKWIMVGDVNQLSPYVEDDFVSEAIGDLIKEKPEEGEKRLESFELRKCLGSEEVWDKRILKIFFSDNHTKKDFDEQLDIFTIDDNFKPTHKNIIQLNAADLVLCKSSRKHQDIIEKFVRVKARIFGREMRGTDFLNHQQYFHRKKNSNNRKSRGISVEHHRFQERLDKDQSWKERVGSLLSQAYQYRLSTDTGSIKNQIRRDLDILVPDKLLGEVENIRKIAFPSMLELLQIGIGKTKTRNGNSLNQIIYNGFNDFENITALKFQSLSFQHRMNEGIAQIPREFFYDGKNLETADTVFDRANPLERYKKTEGDVIWEFNGDNTYHRTGKNINSSETKRIENELKDFLRFARNNPKVENGKAVNYEIAVLSFYNGQVRELRNMLRKFTGLHRKSKFFGIHNIDITLCTVDKFQGDEADMVLLSFVKCTKGAFYNSPNRLNVSLTRARYKLVLFANKKIGTKAPSEALRKMAERFPSRQTH